MFESCNKVTNHLWRPPEGVTGTVRVVSLGSWGVRILGMLLGPSPPPLSCSESTSSTLTAGRRLRLELSTDVEQNHCYLHLTNGMTAKRVKSSDRVQILTRRRRAGQWETKADLSGSTWGGFSCKLGHVQDSPDNWEHEHCGQLFSLANLYDVTLAHSCLLHL